MRHWRGFGEEFFAPLLAVYAWWYLVRMLRDGWGCPAFSVITREREPVRYWLAVALFAILAIGATGWAAGLLYVRLRH